MILNVIKKTIGNIRLATETQNKSGVCNILPKLSAVSLIQRLNQINGLPSLVAAIFGISSLLSLGACASADGPVPTATAVSIATALPQNLPTAILPTSDPACNTLALESWIRNATPNTQGFVELLNRSTATKQAQARQVAAQLAQFGTQISTTVAPPCANAVNAQITSMIGDAVQAFVTLSSDPRTSLQNSISVANARYLQVQKDQQALLAVLNKQLGQ